MSSKRSYSQHGTFRRNPISKLFKLPKQDTIAVTFICTQIFRPTKFQTWKNRAHTENHTLETNNLSCACAGCMYVHFKKTSLLRRRFLRMKSTDTATLTNPDTNRYAKRSKAHSDLIVIGMAAECEITCNIGWSSIRHSC